MPTALTPSDVFSRMMLPFSGSFSPSPGRSGCLQLLRTPLRKADDGGRVGEPLGLGRGAGQRHFIDDHVGAHVAFEQLAQAERRTVHQHLPLPGHDGGQFDILVGRVGPEGAQHRRRQVVHQHVAGSLDGHFALDAACRAWPSLKTVTSRTGIFASALSGAASSPRAKGRQIPISVARESSVRSVMIRSFFQLL